MPVISTFFGIIIRMYFREHGAPHFHAEYQGQQATFSFHGELLAGKIQSNTARRLIKEWAAKNQDALAANWNRIRKGEPLEVIPPPD